MTYEEAIKELSRLSQIRSDGYYDYLANGGAASDKFVDEMMACDMAIEALEKQIPKKPILFVSDRGDYLHAAYKCPNCQDEIETVNDDEPYCSQCGQALLREDTE